VVFGMACDGLEHEGIEWFSVVLWVRWWSLCSVWLCVFFGEYVFVCFICPFIWGRLDNICWILEDGIFSGVCCVM